MIFIVLTGCARTIQEGSYIPEQGLLSLHQGLSAREVQEILGSPAFIVKPNAQETVWFYVSQRKEAVAFLSPTLKEQHVHKLTFRDGSLLHYSTEDRIPETFAQAEETTPLVRTGSPSFLGQMIKNIGRAHRKKNEPEKS